MEQDRNFVTIKTLDNYPRVLFWSIDEFLCLSVPIVIGTGLGCFYILPLGPVLKHFYTKFKRQTAQGAVIHKIYWYLPKSVLRKMGVLKKIPPSHHRELIL